MRTWIRPFAAAASSERIEREHVEAALEAHRHRNARISSRYRDEILRGQLLVDTAGTHVGQINGLAVIMLGDSTFDHPVRITATVRVGDGEVVDIERASASACPCRSRPASSSNNRTVA